MNKKLNIMYFSATGTTKKIVTKIAEEFSENTDEGMTINKIDFTLPEVRKEPVSFTRDDIVIVGVPVYAGRVPNVLLNYLNSIKGNDALAVAVVVYGNRNYDDALIELQDILEVDGFKVIAGGAFIGEHSFSKILAKDRPDEKDLTIAGDFAQRIYRKIKTSDKLQAVTVKGNRPYKKYYVPKNEKGEPVDIRKVTPLTNDNCIDCKVCANVCSMGSIDYEDVSKLNGICIKCCACIKSCPTGAKYFDDKNYLWHKHELEVDFADQRREPELFL